MIHGGGRRPAVARCDLGDRGGPLAAPEPQPAPRRTELPRRPGTRRERGAALRARPQPPTREIPLARNPAAPPDSDDKEHRSLEATRRHPGRSDYTSTQAECANRGTARKREGERQPRTRGRAGGSLRKNGLFKPFSGGSADGRFAVWPGALVLGEPLVELGDLVGLPLDDALEASDGRAGVAVVGCDPAPPE